MKQCLIVDDSPVIRKVARLIVEQVRYTAVEAGDGAEALEKCEEQMPDVILLDWHMPGMPAFEFLDTLAAKYPGDQPLILYCTTNLDAADINQALAAGANDFILKPYDRESLQAKIASLSVAAA